MKKLLLLALFFGLLPLAQAADEDFDHFSTGFVLDGGHLNVSCEGCHAGATFGSTQPICATCHSPGGIVRASIKPPDHILSSGQCADCHITSAWNAVAFVDHTAVTGSCNSCHNGVQATGKSPTHIVSGEQCDDCHTTAAWSPAVFDHANVIAIARPATTALTLPARTQITS